MPSGTSALCVRAGESEDDEEESDEESDDETDGNVLEALASADFGGEVISSVALELDDLVDILGGFVGEMVFLETFFGSFEKSLWGVAMDACLPALLSTFEA